MLKGFRGSPAHPARSVYDDEGQKGNKNCDVNFAFGGEFARARRGPTRLGLAYYRARQGAHTLRSQVKNDKNPRDHF